MFTKDGIGLRFKAALMNQVCGEELSMLVDRECGLKRGWHGQTVSSGLVRFFVER